MIFNIDENFPPVAPSTEKNSNPENKFEVTSLEQLDGCEFNLYPMTPDEITEAETSGKIKKMIEDAREKAEKILEQKGGLTFEDLAVLGFYRKDDHRHRNDL